MTSAISSIALRRKLHESTARSRRLDPDVPESLGTWKTGSRNLVLAIADMKSQKAQDLRSFGNVGMGERWLEIDGERVGSTDAKLIWDVDGPATDRIKEASRFLENRSVDATT
ncbi:hypothetical protein ACC817_16270 [Rhizobium ruizarguesonis]